LRAANSTSYTELVKQYIQGKKMANINNYQFQQRNVDVYPGIWDDKKLKLKPIKDIDDQEMHEILDSITLAVEAGALDNFLWPQQIFASKSVFIEFLKQLSGYDESYRVTDRWWTALSKICEICDEEGFVTGAQIADQLLDSAREDGKLSNFGKKTPTYKFSVDECITASLAKAKHLGAGRPACYLSNSELEAAEEKSSFGRYYSQRATKAEITAAYQEGEALGKAMRAAKRAAAKTKKASKVAKQAS
jgi:hypothetical protein